MCQRRTDGHLWYSDTMTVPPKKPFVVDWCVTCGEPRPTQQPPERAEVDNN